MCLGTAAEVKKKFNQGLKHGNSLGWFGQRGIPLSYLKGWFPS